MKYREIYEEYNSLLAQKTDCSNLLPALKEGYISVKTISGKKYSYLQKKSGGRINSEYIKEGMLAQIQSELQKRRETENQIEMINKELCRIETAVKTLDKSLYHKLIILKRCSLMDSMPVEMRQKSLEFGNAMTALEGIPASADTENRLSLWAAGRYSFKDAYLHALKKYRLMEI